LNLVAIFGDSRNTVAKSVIVKNFMQDFSSDLVNVLSDIRNS